MREQHEIARVHRPRQVAACGVRRLRRRKGLGLEVQPVNRDLCDQLGRAPGRSRDSLATPLRDLQRPSPTAHAPVSAQEEPSLNSLGPIGAIPDSGLHDRCRGRGHTRFFSRHGSQQLSMFVKVRKFS